MISQKRSELMATLPMKELAPLDYRYALDASMALLAGKNNLLVRCNLPELFEEVRQRLPYNWLNPGQASGALWVEPLRDSWSDELLELAACLSDGARLVIIASRPLSAKGRQKLNFLQIRALNRALHKAGFVLEHEYGIHSPQAMSLNFLSQQATRCGYPALGDRLHFAARLRYCTTSPARLFSTVALLVARMARKERN